MSSEVGDFGKKHKVEFLEVELPDTMLKAIKIIERLLTQAKYPEEHVLYRDFPPINLQDVKDDDDEEDGKKKGNFLGGLGARGKKDKAKEEEEKKDEEEYKED